MRQWVLRFETTHTATVRGEFEQPLIFGRRIDEVRKRGNEKKQEEGHGNLS